MFLLYKSRKYHLIHFSFIKHISKLHLFSLKARNLFKRNLRTLHWCSYSPLKLKIDVYWLSPSFDFPSRILINHHFNSLIHLHDFSWLTLMSNGKKEHRWKRLFLCIHIYMSLFQKRKREEHLHKSFSSLKKNEKVL